jgi:hypothetical protein
MRTLKRILGIGFFVAAPLVGGLTWLAFSCTDAIRPVIGVCLVAFSAVLALSLIYAGRLLMAGGNVPMSWKTRMLVTLLLLGFWFHAAVCIPIYVPSPRRSTPSKICINILRQIEAAAQEFALERGKTNGEAINYPNDLTPYLKLNKDGKILPCPQGGIYSINKVGDNPTCSLGANVNPPHVLP